MDVTENKSYSSSLENYLKTIYYLNNEKRSVRSKDIKERLNVKGSSVSVALKILGEKGAIEMERYGPIFITSKGKEWAKKIIERHEMFFDFMHRVLGVEEEKAREVACKMEHLIDEDIAGRLEKYLNKTSEHFCNIIED